jgi:spore coat polysaccharide biosynthesis protein SpsF (cytidylyltransferase family)
MTKLLTILTLRCASERLPNKALAPITSRVPGSARKETLPLAVWILRRLRQMDTMLCVATTESDTDNELTRVMRAEGVEVVRGSTDDVLDRMNAVIQTGQYPGTEWVLRALGDNPFVEVRLIERAVAVMERFKGEAFAWFIPPDSLSGLVYGSREFPVSKSAFDRLVRHAKGDEREHVDLWFHRNRERFNIIYHEPATTYWGDYRVEVDTQADLDVTRQIADEIGMLAPLKEVIAFLRKNEHITQGNRHIMEKTGPKSSYEYKLRRKWYELMSNGAFVVSWDDNVWKPPSDKAPPIFCNSGQCLIGWADKGRLYTKEGHTIAGPSRLSCKCGAGKFFKAAA